jgi:Cytochrome P450
MEVIVVLMLGLEEDSKHLPSLSKWSTASFRGASSAPINVSMGGIFKSKFAQGLEANENMRSFACTRIHHELHIIIKRHRKRKHSKKRASAASATSTKPSTVIEHIAQALFDMMHEFTIANPQSSAEDRRVHKDGIVDSAVNALLLFTCGIVAKAFASLTVWALVHWHQVLECEPDCDSDQDEFASGLQADIRREFKEQLQPTASQTTPSPFLDAYLREVQRMYPPVPFGFRGVKQDTPLCNYRVDADSMVWFSLYSAHRDPTTWTDPNVFNPRRWLSTPNIDTTSMSSIHCAPAFGAGPRHCKGVNLSTMILRTVLILSSQLDYQPVHLDSSISTIKWLPVTRPADGFPITITAYH